MEEKRRVGGEKEEGGRNSHKGVSSSHPPEAMEDTQIMDRGKRVNGQFESDKG